MNKEASFTVPGMVKGKGRPRMTKTGHTYTPKDTVLYENLVRTSFHASYPDWTPLEDEIVVWIDVFYQTPKSFSKKKRTLVDAGKMFPTTKPDCDNIAKSILDSLNGIAYRDDAQVVLLIVSKKYSDIPRTEVILHEYNADEEPKTSPRKGR